MKVLVAEGNEDSRNLLLKQLQDHGHDVIAVANGAEALEKALREKPDILVTDILMPHMDGFMLCHLWRQIDQLRHIPFVFNTSSYTSDEDRQFALGLGANAFISKPTDPEKLIRLMVEVYEKAQSGVPSTAEVALLEPSRYFTEYSKRLSTMLDKKVAQLEREVAERRRAEEELRKSEERFRTLTEKSSDGITIVSADGNVLYESSSIKRILGYSAEDKVGKQGLESLHPDDVTEAIKAFQFITENPGAIVTMVVRVMHKDGSWRWMECLGRNLLEDSRVNGIVINYRDITERKRAEEDLSRARAYLEHSLASAPDGVVLLDKDGKTSYVNTTFLNWLGRSADDFIGKTILEISPPIMTPETTRAIAKKVKKRLETGGAVSGVEIELIGQDGKKMPISYDASAIRDDEGNILGEVGFMRDITERKLAEERIEHLNTVLHAIRKVNQLITREKENRRLIKGACDELVEARGYLNAWIALLDESGSIVTTAEAGLGRNFKPMVEMLKRGELPRYVRDALRQSRVMIIEDPLSTCTDCPLANMCGDYGAVTTRLEHEGRIYGLLSVAIPRGLIGDEEEQALFREVCGDIAFALYNMELEAERKRAEEELRESEERYRTVFNTAPASIILIDSKGRMVDVSPYHINNIGRGKITKEDLVGKNILKHPTIVNAGLSETYRRVLEGEPFDIKDVYFPTLMPGGDGYFNVKGMPLFQDEEVIGAVIAHEDITERKWAEEELKGSEKRFEDIARSSADWIWEVDANGKYTFAAGRVQEILGYAAEELIGKTPFELMPEEEAKRVGVIFEKTASKKETIVDLENWCLTKNGGLICLLTNGVPILDNTGSLIGYRGVDKDITDRKRAEEELQESEARSRAILDAIPDLVFQISKDGTFLSYKGERFAGLALPPSEFLGKKIYETMPTEFAKQVMRCIKRVLQKGDIQYLNYQLPVPLPNGDLRDFEARFVAINEDEVVVIARDITERKRAEEELSRVKAYLEHSLASAPDGVVLLDKDGKTSYVNNTFLNWLGRSADDFIGKTILEISPPIMNPETTRTIADKVKKRLETGGAVAGVEIELIGKDGKKIPISYDASEIKDDGGNILGEVGFMRDITERKQAEQTILSERDRLQALMDGLATTEIGIDIVGIDYRVMFHNETLKQRFGDLTGQLCYEAYRGLKRPCDFCPMRRAIKNKRVEGSEMLGVNGRYYEVVSAPLPDPDGRIDRAIEVVTDITERKRAEGERESAARRAEALRDVAQAVNRSLELDELLNESLATVLHIMETDVGGIYLFDMQSGEFALKAHIGISEDTVASIGLIKPNGKEIKRVLEWQKPLLVPFSLSSGANATQIAGAIRKEGMRAHITVPIRFRDILIGALLLASRRERQFRADEVELLRDIGNELAVGIENAMLLMRTKELSLTDELTGLYNRRHLYHMLEPEMYRTLRKGRSFSLVMLDLDGFKEYNDKMGHASGDSVLQAFAQTIGSSLRKSDTAFRYGGDEFIIILPETDAKRAMQIMGRIRARWFKLVEAQYAPLETPLGFCTGIAQFPENADTADGLVFLADSALYYAKREGGGRDILVSSLSSIPPELLGAATLDQVYALAATVDARDPYTYGHSGRVAGIAQKIGKAIGLSEKELANLYAASLLHDVGKVGVPDAILTKPGALTAEEWVTIKKHSAEGARIVGYVRGLGALVPVIMHHHEWYDGTGYPDGLKGEETPLAARIISVADAYDTMTTARPYREVVSHQEAVEELRRCSGTQFDPELVEAFCRAMNGDSGQGKKRKPASE